MTCFLSGLIQQLREHTVLVLVVSGLPTCCGALHIQLQRYNVHDKQIKQHRSEISVNWAADVILDSQLPGSEAVPFQLPVQSSAHYKSSIGHLSASGGSTQPSFLSCCHGNGGSDEHPVRLEELLPGATPAVKKRMRGWMEG